MTHKAPTKVAHDKANGENGRALWNILALIGIVIIVVLCGAGLMALVIEGWPSIAATETQRAHETAAAFATHETATAESARQTQAAETQTALVLLPPSERAVAVDALTATNQAVTVEAATSRAQAAGTETAMTQTAQAIASKSGIDGEGKVTDTPQLRRSVTPTASSIAVTTLAPTDNRSPSNNSGGGAPQPPTAVIPPLSSPIPALPTPLPPSHTPVPPTGTPVLPTLTWTIPAPTATTPPPTLTATPEPTLTLPAATSTYTPVYLFSCPEYQETGVGNWIDIDINVPANQIAFIDAVGLDTRSEHGVFVTITGPYHQTHTIFDGAYCGGISIFDDYADLRAKRKESLGPEHQEIFLGPTP